MFQWLHKLKQLLVKPPVREEPLSPYDEAAAYYRSTASVNEDIYGDVSLIDVVYRRIDLYIQALELLERSLKDPSQVEQIRHPDSATVRVCDFYLDRHDCLVDLETTSDRFFTLAESVIELYQQERKHQHQVSKLDYVLRRTAPIVDNLSEMAKHRIHGRS